MFPAASPGSHILFFIFIFMGHVITIYKYDIYFLSFKYFSLNMYFVFVIGIGISRYTSG